MTVIVWDGQTLAADKRCTSGGGIARTVTKIERFECMGDFSLLAMTGNWDVAVEMREWWKSGEDPMVFPAKAREDSATLIVITRDRIVTYASGPYPMPIEQMRCAFGTGRDYAEAAMYCGKTAAEAVSIACIFQIDCGNGIDTLTLEPTVPEEQPKGEDDGFRSDTNRNV